jgi:hypothetical protein
MRSGLSRRALPGLLVLAFSGTTAARQPSRFSFELPPGWVDLADGASEEAREKLNAGLIQASTKKDFLAFAADLEADENGRNSFLQAILLPGALPVTVETLPRIRDALRQRSESEGVPIEMQSVEISRIGEVDVARARWVVHSEGGDEMRLAYVIPGGNRAALLIYGCPAERFEKLRPLFQGLAERTKGAEAPPPPAVWGPLAINALKVGAVLAVLAFVLGKSRKKAIPRAPLPPASPRKAPGRTDESPAKTTGRADEAPTKAPDQADEGQKKTPD